MNTIRRFCFGVVAALATIVGAQAASPAGTWFVDMNGYTGTLVLAVTSTGAVSGFALNDPIAGFWNDSAGKLTFYRTAGGTLASMPPSNIQIFTGYMHPCLVSSPTGSQCLDGYFEAFAGTGGTASKNVFGWHGTR
jgi:hypothetical protein